MIQAIRDQKRLAIVIICGCLMLGILYGIVTPVEYKSDAKVMPELNRGGESQFNNLLQNYGGLLGMGGDNLDLSKDGTISPQVYPQILQSIAFQHKIMKDTIYFANLNKPTTIYEYFNERNGPLFKGWIGGESEENQELKSLPSALEKLVEDKELSSASKREMQVIKELRSRINIEFDSESGVMNISAVMPDEVAAAQVCNNAINLLTDYLKEYRTQKAQSVLEFANEQYKVARQRLKEAQNALASFQDQNLNLNTAKAQSRQQYLQAEFDLAYNVYNSVAQKRIQARMKLQENTPVFKTLQAANIPIKAAQPQWIAIIVLSIVLGLILSFLVIAGRSIRQNLQN